VAPSFFALIFVACSCFFFRLAQNRWIAADAIDSRIEIGVLRRASQPSLPRQFGAIVCPAAIVQR